MKWVLTIIFETPFFSFFFSGALAPRKRTLSYLLKLQSVVSDTVLITVQERTFQHLAEGHNLTHLNLREELVEHMFAVPLLLLRGTPPLPFSLF